MSFAGKLRVRVTAVAPAPASSPDATASPPDAQQQQQQAAVDLRGGCGFPLLPRLRLLVSASSGASAGDTGSSGSSDSTSSTSGGSSSSSSSSSSSGDEGLPAGLAAVVWKDPLNITFAADTLTATLPPFSDGWVREAAAADSPACAYGCDAAYRVRLVSWDGAQTLVVIRVVEVTLRHYLLHISYRHHLLQRIDTESEVVYLPLLSPVAPLPAAAPPSAAPVTADGDSSGGSMVGGSGPAAWGMQLLGDAQGPQRLGGQAVVWRAEQLPPTGCSGQWSLTLLLQVGRDGSREGGRPGLGLHAREQAGGQGGGV